MNFNFQNKVWLFMVFMVLNSMCSDKNSHLDDIEFCETDSYTAGEVNAETNLNSFSGYALFSYSEDSSHVSLNMGDLWDTYCGWNEDLKFLVIDPSKLNDTIYLTHVSENGITSEFPTAIYNQYDHDVREHTYELYTDDSLSDWIYIDSYKPDSSLITGKFQVSLQISSSRDTTLNNLYPPNIIYFKKGVFEAYAAPTY